jgi:hypothetical protein
VPPGEPGIDTAIEPDLRNAGPFLGLVGGSVTVTGWPTRTTQVEQRWLPSSPTWAARCSFAETWYDGFGDLDRHRHW